MMHSYGPPKNLGRDTVVTIGKFDGLHIGHREIISHLKETAKQQNLAAALISFYPHPAAVLNKKPISLLLSPQEKKEQLEQLGIDVYAEYHFNQEFSQILPERFIADIIVKEMRARILIVGEEYRFGKDRAGDIGYARRVGEPLGLSVISLAHIQDADSRKISSNSIRQAIASGDLKLAKEMMQQDFFVSGPVIHGAELGKKIGFPTANILPYKDKLLPPNGVYKTQTHIREHIYASVTNIGTKPTFGGKVVGIESHLLDFNKDVYGENIRIDFLEYLRPEMKFAGVDELKAQMAQDIEAAKR